MTKNPKRDDKRNPALEKMMAKVASKSAHKAGKRPRKPSQAKAEASLAKRRKAAGMRLLSPVWLDADVAKLVADAKCCPNIREMVNNALRQHLG